jgi:hypothetical protein
MKTVEELYKKFASIEHRYFTGYDWLMSDFDFAEAIKEYDKQQVNVEPEVMQKIAELYETN